MNATVTIALADARGAVARANGHLAAGHAQWCPVFADVVVSDFKVGHVVSDGYSNTRWSFYPVGENHRHIHNKDLETVVPKWVKRFRFGEFRTYAEIHPIQIRT